MNSVVLGTPAGYLDSPHHASPHPTRSAYQHFFGPNAHLPPVNGGSGTAGESTSHDLTTTAATQYSQQQNTDNNQVCVKKGSRFMPKMSQLLCLIKFLVASCLNSRMMSCSYILVRNLSTIRFTCADSGVCSLLMSVFRVILDIIVVPS